MVVLFELHRISLASAGRPQVVDGAVARHRQQPRAHRPLLGIESANAVPHPQERLLHQILRDAGVTHHAENQRIDQTAVPVVEFRQCLRIPALHARDQFRIVFSGVDGQQYGKQHHARLIVYTRAPSIKM